MRALFAFSYIVRIVVIHFILINSSIANAKKYQIVRNESNLETLARPTDMERISDGRILSKNLSDRSFRKDRLFEFGKKNVVLHNESAHRPSEDVKGVASLSTNSHRRSKRCILAGMLHHKMRFAKHFFFRPPVMHFPRPRPPKFVMRPPPPVMVRPPSQMMVGPPMMIRPGPPIMLGPGQPMMLRPGPPIILGPPGPIMVGPPPPMMVQPPPPTSRTEPPRPETSRRRPPPPRHIPRRTRPPTRSTTTRPKRRRTKTPSSAKVTMKAPSLGVLTKSPPAAAHTPNELEFRETTAASIVPGCKFIVHPGVPVINGKPNHDIGLAVIVEQITVIRRPPGYFVWEFVHPTIKACIELPVFGSGDTYVDPISKRVFIIFVDIRNTTLLIPKLGPTVERTETCIYRFDKTLIFKTYWNRPGLGSSVVNGFPHHNVKTALWVWRTTKVIDSTGILVHRFPHPTDNYEVQIPAYGTDEYFESETSQVFLLFVDKRNRTLVVYKGVIEEKKIVRERVTIEKGTRQHGIRMVQKYRELGYKYGWGSIVVRGVPKYRITGAKFVYKTETLINNEGFVVIQFEHPITGQRIQIPPKGGDEYVLPSSSKTLIIFVDSAKRTLLIAKNLHRPKVPRDCVNGINVNVNLAVMKYREIAQKRNVGLTVIAGAPKYDIRSSIFVNATYKIIDSDSFLVIYFIHPNTGEGIQIPVDGADEYILARESKVYVIFVDRFGRTLLIFKGPHLPSARKPPGKKPHGSIVIQGVPKYNESCVIFVNNTDQLVHSQKVPMIQFVHPITGEKIQIPANGGDEFLLPSTSQVFLIFVDREDRTLLIFKGKYTPKEPKNHGNGSNCKNLLATIWKYRQIARERQWGSMVIRGLPKYNKSCAIYVNKAERILDPEGCSVIRFVHPITEQKIQIPANGGDEYVVPSISKIFLIFVDPKGRTLLVFKPPPSAAKPPPPTGGSKCPNVYYAINKYRVLARDRNWGTMVVQGAPKYNTMFGIFVDRSNKMLDTGGCVMIQFVHPVTEQKIEIPYYGGDEFVVPSSSKTFIIFVDSKARTLFVFKDKYVSKEPQSPNDRGNKCPSITRVIKKYQQMAREKEWGSIVIHGVPKYSPSFVTFVHKREITVDSDGCLIIQFTHPVTKQEMHVPYNGGDEFVMSLESNIYVVFIDTNGRTLLIFKDKIPPSDTKPTPNDRIVEKDREKPKEPSSIVTAGGTKYNISGAIFVDETERAEDPDGFLLIRFVHPLTGELIKIPFYGGVPYTPPFTTKVYIVFVDTKGRTLLIRRPKDQTNGGPPEIAKTVSFAIRKYGEMAKKNGWGSIVIRGVPEYDISRAIFVDNAENKIDSDGCLVIEFVHPITKQKILIPYHGGDEYVLSRTSRVYVLFVDTKGRTLLIFKNQYPSTEAKPKKDIVDRFEKQQLPDASDSNKEEILKKWWDLSMEEGWGWLAVRGVPKYDISRAIFVMKTEKVTDTNGIKWIRFVHPVTGQGIKVPCVGTDEYTLSRTSQVFLIFVDLQRRTLLILKADGIIPQDIGWGTLVVGGHPRYDLFRAIYVIERETTVDVKGTVMLQLVHPESKEIVRMPLFGGDEYVDPLRAKIFLIVVDSRGKTILIFKGMDDARWKSRDVDKLDGIVKNYDLMARANSWGTLVIGGMPKHNSSRAVIVTKTKTESGKNGMVMIRFEDPRNNRKMLVPFLGGDEYVNPRSLNIYVMFVDLQGQLLLILKGIKNSRESLKRLPSGDDHFRKEPDFFIREYSAIAHRNKWGTLVRNGRPKYNLEKAIIVRITSRTRTSNGHSIITFVHPINSEKMYIPAFGGDEYVVSKTREIFVIFVDAQGRTCLIPQSNDPNYGPIKQGIENFGNKPVITIANATYVPSSSLNENGRGNMMINFVHPITDDLMKIEENQCEEYYDPKSQKGFNIFIDRGGRTLLIPKPESSPSFAQNIPGSMDDSKNININKNINNNVFLPGR